MDEDKSENSRKNDMSPYREIEALMDGELDATYAKVLLNKISEDPVLERHYNKLKKQKALLKKWWEERQKHSE